MFFVGTHTPKLDEKGRLFLPAKFREQLSEDVVIAPGQERCLEVWSAQEFQGMAAELQRKSRSVRDTRGYIRYLMANSSPETPDRQGRVTVNGWLREYAGLDREVVVTGALDHAEIWNPETWQTMQALSADDYANIDGPIGRDEV